MGSQRKDKRGLEIGARLLFLLLLRASCMLNDATASDGDAGDTLNKKRNANRPHAHLTVDDSVGHMVNHPAFKGFGRYLLPLANGASVDDRPLNDVGSLMPYHSHVEPDVVVAAVNHMIDRVNDGETLFHEFYTEQERREDPAKASTGIFFFRGQPDAPFAVVCPGGGFAYVGALHEGFPLAVALSRKGTMRSC